MLLTIEGYFEAGRFITDMPVHIPEGKKTIVTVLDEAVNTEAERKAYKKRWDKIIKDVQNSNEILEGEPERLTRIFKNPEEVGTL